jgi:hypothetical protein
LRTANKIQESQLFIAAIATKHAAGWVRIRRGTSKAAEGAAMGMVGGFARRAAFRSARLADSTATVLARLENE